MTAVPPQETPKKNMPRIQTKNAKKVADMSTDELIAHVDEQCIEDIVDIVGVFADRLLEKRNRNPSSLSIPEEIVVEAYFCDLEMHLDPEGYTYERATAQQINSLRHLGRSELASIVKAMVDVHHVFREISTPNMWDGMEESVLGQAAAAYQLSCEENGLVTQTLFEYIKANHKQIVLVPAKK